MALVLSQLTLFAQLKLVDNKKRLKYLTILLLLPSAVVRVTDQGKASALLFWVITLHSLVQWPLLFWTTARRVVFWNIKCKSKKILLLFPRKRSWRQLGRVISIHVCSISTVEFIYPCITQSLNVCRIL